MTTPIRSVSKRTAQTILANPRYTGRMVWNRQPRHEVLVDVDDVALGHRTTQRWADPVDWVWSASETHKAIIDIDTFAAVTEGRAAGTHRPVTSKPRCSPRPYLLRGLVFCGICGRRMESTWNHEQAHYRCRYPAEYAATNGISHPRTVYLREAAILGPLDRWLATLFAPKNLDETLGALAAAPNADESANARVEAARRAIVDADTRLERHRTAIENGVDPKLVSTWISAAQGARLAAEAVLAESSTQTPPSLEELRDLIAQVGDVTDMLEAADPDLKAAVYADLGITLTYQPTERVAETRPVYVARVGGANGTECQHAVLRGELMRR